MRTEYLVKHGLRTQKMEEEQQADFVALEDDLTLVEMT